MSYPPGPNNPYGTGPYGYPPQQQGPGYGHPPHQQPTMPPGYAFPPQQPPQPQGPFGVPPRDPKAPPKQANAARIMMIMGGAVQTLFMLFALVLLIAARHGVDDVTRDVNLGLNLGYALVAVFLIVGAAGIALGVQFTKGGNTMRVLSVAWAVLIVICGLVAITTVGAVWVGLGGATIALLCQPETVAWFRATQH